jgi:hypothetical protein
MDAGEQNEPEPQSQPKDGFRVYLDTPTSAHLAAHALRMQGLEVEHEPGSTVVIVVGPSR